jgi:radical SAM superfamily enzyme YgiQ (UPF0313 family)
LGHGVNAAPTVAIGRLTSKRSQPTTSTVPPVLLIIPPSPFLLDERVFMSLGALKVAAVLEQAGGHVEVLDLSGVANFLEALEDSLRVTKASVAALTTTTPQLPAASQIVKRIRERSPHLRVIAGGPHVTLVSAAVKLERKAGRVGRAHRALAQLHELFDVLVAGDGEVAVFEALRPGAPSLIDGDEPQGGLFMSNQDYEASPLPARHLVDVNSYRYSIEGHRAVSLIAQLGCPFGCGFCGGRNSKALRKRRTRTTANIVREIEHLYRRYGATGFMFYDDELNVSQSLVELMDALTALQSRLGVEFRLRGFVKSELFTDEQAAAMRRAGFRWVLCGFEAASPRILDNINKRATLEDNTRVLDIARRHDLKVKALMSVGHPGESAETVQSVADWLISVRPDDFDCTVITTYPGTPYYDEALETSPGVWTYTAKRTGDRLHAYDVDYTQISEYYKGEPNGGYHSYVFTDHLRAEEIVKMRDEVESSVRASLGIPFNAAAPAIRYEHSMGQGPMPGFLLRSTATAAA